MKLKLAMWYDYKNLEGSEFEILDIIRDDKFASNFGVLVKLNGKTDPILLTIEWFLPDPKKQY